MTVEELLAARKWKPIPHCPGRYVLAEPEPALAPEQLEGVSHTALEFQVEAVKDRVLVLVLGGGGLITYRRSDGSYHHTLNNKTGFQRKLAQLGICLESGKKSTSRVTDPPAEP